MTQIKTAPFGSWKSPITAGLIAEHSIRFGSVFPADDRIYWVEMRPHEAGRSVLVRRDASGDVVDIAPAPYDVRTTVHEYGGGSFTVHDGVAYFSNFKDQRLYRLEIGEEPAPITSDTTMRYADMLVDTARNRLICASGRAPKNSSTGWPSRNSLTVGMLRIPK